MLPALRAKLAGLGLDVDTDDGRKKAAAIAGVAGVIVVGGLVVWRYGRPSSKTATDSASGKGGSGVSPTFSQPKLERTVTPHPNKGVLPRTTAAGSDDDGGGDDVSAAVEEGEGVGGGGGDDGDPSTWLGAYSTGSGANADAAAGSSDAWEGAGAPAPSVTVVPGEGGGRDLDDEAGPEGRPPPYAGGRGSISALVEDESNECVA